MSPKSRRETRALWNRLRRYRRWCVYMSAADFGSMSRRTVASDSRPPAKTAPLLRACFCGRLHRACAGAKVNASSTGGISNPSQAQPPFPGRGNPHGREPRVCGASQVGFFATLTEDPTIPPTVVCYLPHAACCAHRRVSPPTAYLAPVGSPSASLARQPGQAPGSGLMGSQSRHISVDQRVPVMVKQLLVKRQHTPLPLLGA